MKTGTKLRITKKKFQDEELPHELFLIISNNNTKKQNKEMVSLTICQQI